MAGMSWSGNERNRVFLNTGGQRFADISAVAGFDFADDCRSLALVDWDHDGDSDVWLANRTSPQVRFLRNNASDHGHFVAVRLTGVSANRDAIGARVELQLAAGHGLRLVKTLRAGEGFVGQSSKWLHFGLGQQDEVRQLVVHWPGGATETFGPLRGDQHYRITEGTGSAELWSPPSRTIRLEPSTLAAVKPRGPTRAVLSNRLPLPELPYVAPSGEQRSIAQHNLAPHNIAQHNLAQHNLAPRPGRLLLLNLWASWCAPCVAELTALARRADELHLAGLDVLALSIDGLDSRQASGDHAARRVLQRIDFPFPSAAATPELVDKLQMINDHVFTLDEPLPVPTSILIDSAGWMAAIYKGPVDVSQLLSDVRALKDGAAPSAVSGRWYLRPEPLRLLPLVSYLLAQGYIEDGRQFIDQFQHHLSADADYANLLSQLGGELLRRRRVAEAIVRYEAALKVRPDDPEAHYNLAVALAARQRVDDAIRQYRRAISLAPDDPRSHNNLASLLASRGQLQLAETHFRHVIQLQPQYARAHFNLGNVCLARKQFSEAVKNYRRAVEIRPDYADAHRNLAIALKNRGDRDEAMRHLREAMKLQRNGQPKKNQSSDARP